MTSRLSLKQSGQLAALFVILTHPSWYLRTSQAGLVHGEIEEAEPPLRVDILLFSVQNL